MHSSKQGKRCFCACFLHTELERENRSGLDHFMPVKAVSSSLSQNHSEIKDSSTFVPFFENFGHFWTCELPNFLVSVWFEKGWVFVIFSENFTLESLARK